MRNVLSRLKRHKRGVEVLMASASMLIIFSCQTIPEKADQRSSVQLLPKGADIIISADVQNNLELIEPVIEALGESVPDNLAKEFTERTDTVWAGLDFNSDTGKTVTSIAAEGSYPVGMINWGLKWDRGWVKQKYSFEPELDASMNYWTDERNSNQIALPSREYMLVSSGNIEEMLSSWAFDKNGIDNGEWLQMESGSDVTIMTRNLTPEDYGRFIPEFKRVPLKSLILSLNRADGYYLISGRFHMDSNSNAFLFSTIFRMLVLAAKDEEGNKLFPDIKAVKIKMEDSDVVISGIKLKVENLVETEKKWMDEEILKLGQF